MIDKELPKILQAGMIVEVRVGWNSADGTTQWFCRTNAVNPSVSQEHAAAVANDRSPRALSDVLHRMRAEDAD